MRSSRAAAGVAVACFALTCAAGHGEVAVREYAQLRRLRGRAGDSVRLRNADRPQVDGLFRFATRDPYGNGDDGGIVLAGRNGYWVRETTGNPPLVHLDWFGFDDGDDATETLARLARAFAPDLRVVCPSREMTLVVDYLDWDQTISTFHLSSAGAEVVFVKRADTPDRDHRKTMLSLRGYREVVIGAGITFDGNYDRIGGSARGDPAEQGGGWGLLDFAPADDARLLDVRCNTRDAPAFGINHTGGANRVARALVGGRHVNSGLRLNSGIADLHLADAYVSDPRGVGIGYVTRQRFQRWLDWLTRTKGTAVAQREAQQAHWSADRTHVQVKDLFEKTRGVWMQNCDRVTGRVVLQYGNAHWFMSMNGELGTSKQDPLVIEYRDLGYTEGGKPTPVEGFLAPGGKPDALREVGPGKRFVRLVSNGRFNLRYSFVVEATRESPRARVYRTNDMHWECVNLAKPVSMWVVGRGDEVKRHQLTGTIDSRIVLGVECTLCDLKFRQLTLAYKVHAPKYRGEPPPGSLAEEGAHHNQLRNCTLLPSGQIVVAAGAHDNVIRGLRVEGEPRCILHIANAGHPDRPVSLEVSGLSGPGLAGSTICADDWHNVRCAYEGRFLQADTTLP